MTPLTYEDNQPNIPPVDHSTLRNTFFYASDDRDNQLGSLWVTLGITNHNFHSMVEIVCQFSDTFELRDNNGRFVGRDGEQLLPGNYYIVTNGSIALTEEAPLLRTGLVPSGTRTRSFHEAVLHRDGGCVLTGMPAVPGRWIGLQATHIFPLAYEGHWNHLSLRNLITIPPDRESDGSINAVQNGISLNNTMHSFFNSYIVAINPYDEYKIVSFRPEPLYCSLNTHVDPQLRQNRGWPPDKLLGWHFRQAVLTNMKGTGEPCFADDFPPGSDMIGEIMSCPKAAERMEFEIFGRFNAIESCG